jgi:arsenate reductase
MKVTIWHNPRCSKSRATLTLLRDRGIEPTIVDYLEMPPSPTQLRELLGLLGLEPRALMRRQEAPYADEGLARADLGEKALIDAMVAHPILIERPIVLVEKDGQRRATIGRPPEAVLGLL